ncbi:putative UDP-glucuronate 4-epimerase [Blattamonas nauphoetae]|uniref:UDP-glucuronate 4-epimerase n=1 Tax=Blattamonas nauphoetae TaxID=2049346 RepID=A0ABQ9X839_9EUKA|nr:putative UDP-glucuronate 4-epimerase [Blattamonas nauphoetae]
MNNTLSVESHAESPQQRNSDTLVRSFEQKFAEKPEHLLQCPIPLIFGHSSLFPFQTRIPRSFFLGDELIEVVFSRAQQTTIHSGFFDEQNDLSLLKKLTEQSSMTSSFIPFSMSSTNISRSYGPLDDILKALIFYLIQITLSNSSASVTEIAQWIHQALPTVSPPVILSFITPILYGENNSLIHVDHSPSKDSTPHPLLLPFTLSSSPNQDKKHHLGFSLNLSDLPADICTNLTILSVSAELSLTLFKTLLAKANFPSSFIENEVIYPNLNQSHFQAFGQNCLKDALSTFQSTLSTMKTVSDITAQFPSLQKMLTQVLESNSSIITEQSILPLFSSFVFALHVSRLATQIPLVHVPKNGTEVHPTIVDLQSTLSLSNLSYLSDLLSEDIIQNVVHDALIQTIIHHFPVKLNDGAITYSYPLFSKAVTVTLSPTLPRHPSTRLTISPVTVPQTHLPLLSPISESLTSLVDVHSKSNINQVKQVLATLSQQVIGISDLSSKHLEFHLRQSSSTSHNITFSTLDECAITGTAVIITGAAGFIASWLIVRLIKSGVTVIGIDSLNDYYDPSIKINTVSRLEEVARCEMNQRGGRFVFIWADVREKDTLKTKLMNVLNVLKVDSLLTPQPKLTSTRLSAIVHLSARAGVRPSMLQPDLFKSENVLGTEVMFSLASQLGVKNIVYASSSSVYGNMKDGFCSEECELAKSESVYAETKVQNEQLAMVSSSVTKSAFTGLRFFTVGGPMVGSSAIGRPDMAIPNFIRMLRSKGQSPLTMYGDGSFKRDYTSVFDIVEGIHLSLLRAERCLDPNRPNGQLVSSSTNNDLCRVFNLGEDHSYSVRTVAVLIANELGMFDHSPSDILDPNDTESQKQLLEKLLERGWVKCVPAPPGDVDATITDLRRSRSELLYSPRISLTDTIRKCVVDTSDSACFEGSLLQKHFHEQTVSLEGMEEQTQNSISKILSLSLPAQFTLLAPLMLRFALDDDPVTPRFKRPAFIPSPSLSLLKERPSLFSDHRFLFTSSDLLLIGILIDQHLLDLNLSEQPAFSQTKFGILQVLLFILKRMLVSINDSVLLL